PALAKSLDISDDNLTYTVKLKDGLSWHDGKPLTADDVVFTVNSILDTKQNSPNRGNFVFDNKPLKVVAVDDTTVKFTLPTVAPA
ncbi:ABC transporter substrate-binding protein, partial [Listeria monocytogenes]|nr:ABC transporter substrate-binding protein [Listeria monocytogenes]